LVLLAHLNSNHFCICAKTQLHMFQFYISWVIVCKNYIFSLYALPPSHYDDDGECGGDLTTNGWMFNTLELFVFLNFSFGFFFFNNFASSFYLCLCSFFYVSFSLTTLYNFTITHFALMLLCILELLKHTQLLTTNKLWQLFRFFVLKLPAHCIHFMTCSLSFN
jgi:hypothetical protein